LLPSQCSPGYLFRRFSLCFRTVEVILKPENHPASANSIKFSVIGLNHGHIYGMTDALIGGGGKLVSVYAKEPELLAGFTKRYPDVKTARSEQEILEDNSVQLVASASIPIERAPLGIRVMKAGKDFMADINQEF
jgi:predicted dehydrogenase